MSVSTIPAVLFALRDIAVTAVGSAGTVLLGEPLTGLPNDFVCVGWSGDGPGVDSGQSIGDYAVSQQQEDYTISSESVAWQGDTNLAACLSRVYGLVDPIAEVIAADPQLNDTCMLAQLASAPLTLLQTGKGAMAVVRWSVRVQASR